MSDREELDLDMVEARAAAEVRRLREQRERALRWLRAEPGEPAWRDDPFTRLAEVYTELTGGDTDE